MDQYMIFVAGLIVGMIAMAIIVIACNLGKAEEEEDKKSKLDHTLDYLASEGIIYLDPWEEIVRVDENKYMIKIKGRR